MTKSSLTTLLIKVWVGISLIAVLSTCVCAAEPNINSPSARIGAQQFAILPWGGLPSKQGGFWGYSSNIDAVMQDLFDAGFNIAGITEIGNIAAAKKHHLAIIASGMPSIKKLSDADAVAASKKWLASYSYDPALLGVFLQDEPSSSAFKQIARSVNTLKSINPNIRPYVNLLPNYAPVGMLGAESYDAYIDKFVNTCNPKLLCYDNYAFSEETGLDADRYYSNLEIIRNKSLYYKLPFWNIVLSNAHFKYAEPTQATISLQVFSSLAYGVKGLAYFTYYTPTSGNFRLAAINQFGKKTKTWDYIQFANLQVHRLAPTYLKLHSVNVFHTTNIPNGCRGLESSLHLSAVDGENLLVGEFEDANKVPYVLLVNKSLTNSTSVVPKFKQEGDMAFTNPYTGEDDGFSGEHLWLAPGQGVLVHLQK